MKLLALNHQQTDLIKKAQRFMPPTLSVILLVLACYTLAEITWQLLEPEPSTQQSGNSSKNTTQTKKNNGQFQQQIIKLNNAHLFGLANAPAVKQATKDAPETTLNLVLRGILSTQPMTLASVIISSGKRGKELTYGIGDSVPGNATIEEIHNDRVVLMRNGRAEILKLPEKSVGDLNTGVQSGSNKTLNTNQPADRILGDIRRDIMKNPTSFGEYAIPVPVSKNGKLQGYRLRPQKKGRELFKQFGLQRNDIVTQINGVALNDPVQGIAALRKLSNASSIDLTVLRNGVETPLQFNIH